MPRQLPWLKGGKSTVKWKPVSKPVKKALVPADVDEDDDFFAGTILESSRKTRRTAGGSYDELPDHSLSTTREGKYRARRAPSSSPPPSQSEVPPPQIEFMRKGANRFDLRDDEWMMVEDELLATAKIFTRHLHLAEYELLREKIKQKNKEIPRPVVQSSGRSEESKFNEKARAQAKAQKKALEELNGSSDSDDLDYHRKAAKTSKTGFSTSARENHRLAKMPQIAPDRRNASDSDDLDAPRRPRKPDTTAPVFAKPALPWKPRATPSCPSRAAPFSMPDEHTPKRSSSPSRAPTASTPTPSAYKLRASRLLPWQRLSPPPANRSITESTRRSRPGSNSSKPSLPERPSSPPRPAPSQPAHSKSRPSRAFDLFDELDRAPRNSSPTKQDERSELPAKRKAEKRQETDNRKAAKLDDIPTFLF